MVWRKRLLFLALIMVTVSLVVGGIAIYVLYMTAFEEERARLVETAQSQARLIEAVARFDSIYSRDYPGGAEAATLSQLTDAHEHYEGFGETGEFTLARREGNHIVFLLSHRHYGLAYPRPVHFDSGMAEPMRLALLGRSGSIVGLDYRGELVLAAYEPVAELNLGIVAKIDLAEIQAPFWRAGIVTGGLALLVIVLGVVLFIRISNPMIRRMEEYSERLEEMVDKRTEELRESQERLLTSERLATVGQFSGSISHELRNPLGVIDSSVYYLKTRLEGADEKVQEHLDRINSSVGSATAIIESLLNLTQMEEPQLEGLDLIAITHDATITHEVLDTVNVIRDFPEQEVLVNADREQLGMAFQNIVKNGVEAMDGKGTLTVTVHTTTDGQAEVSFADSGPGITAENLDKIFQPLFSTKAKGIGFGLSIAKMVIDKHGGTIEAKSESGKGAIFIIRLPLYVDKAKEV